MKRNAYIVLCVIAIGLLGYTVYYASTHSSTKEVLVITTSTTEIATTTVEVLDEKKTFTTASGKKIKLTETNPNGESLSTITITPSGFASNSPIILETNKMTNSSYADLNKDSFEELIITTTAQGSGSIGEVYIFTTASNSMLLPVTIPEITEEDTQKGGLFEGYMGHDTFSLINGHLERTFPTYKKEDPNSSPTGPIRSITYSLIENNGSYSVLFSKNTPTSGTLPIDAPMKPTTITAPTTPPPLPPSTALPKAPIVSPPK